MKLGFSNPSKDPGQKSSLGSFQHYQSLSPHYSQLALSKKHSSLSTFPYPTRSPDQNQETLKIQEAYQFLKLRNIGYTRTEAISLSSKFKIKRESYLTSLSPEYKKWNKNFSEDKYKFINSSKDDLLNMTRICEDSVGSYDKNNDYKKRKISLRILTSKEAKGAMSERELYKGINGLVDKGKNERQMEKMRKEQPLFNANTGNCRNNSDLKASKREDLPLRKKNNFNHSGSVEEEYFELLEREKELREKIKAQRYLTSKNEKQAKLDWNSRRRADKKRLPNNINPQTRPTKQKT